MPMTRKESLLFFAAFFLLWIYLIVRSSSVFYVHDEIVSKWSYMINWNYLPFEGYVDANNHFLNSFLGGLFIRLFQSETIWVVRLGNILAFPLFAWAIYGFRTFFNKKIGFVTFALSVGLIHFVLEFFALARGYGLAWAFYLFALLQMMLYLEKSSLKHVFLALLSFLMCIYANLSCLPMALIGIGLLILKSLSDRNFRHLLIFLPFTYPFYYFLDYSFQLQSLGKLYLGDANSFYGEILHPISIFLFSYAHWSIDALFTLIAIVIIVTFLFQLRKTKQLQVKWTFPLLFSLGLIGMLLQNWILNINYPEDRGIVPLLLVFFGSIAFLMDHFQLRKASYAWSLVLLISFLSQLNFSHTQTYWYCHFDKALLTSIPEKVQGIPTSTGGRPWAIDNELAREMALPLRANQSIGEDTDTLVDYIVTFLEDERNYTESYTSILHDSISDLQLLKRNSFLKRTKVREQAVSFENSDEYINLLMDIKTSPSFVRCTGQLENMDMYKDPVIIFTAEDSVSKEKLIYEGVAPTSNVKPGSDGKISFDFSYAIRSVPTAKEIKVYIYNPQKVELKGTISTEVYRIDPTL